MDRRTVAERDNEAGFTLIELLVVVLVVGVLSTLAIPSFLNQRAKGQDACAKAMVKQMHTALLSLQTSSPNGTYAGATTASLTAVESSIGNARCGGSTTVSVGSTGASGACGGAAADNISFCIAATSVSGTSFAIIQNGAVTPPTLVRSCSQPGSGACDGGGTW